LPAPDGTVAVREGDALARTDTGVAQRWQRAARLADRYGLSLGPEATPESRPLGAPDSTMPEPRSERPIDLSSNGVHRSQDAYHGSYNDYLWQLALADGTTPEIELNHSVPNARHEIDRAAPGPDEIGDDIT
jgi:hypothetical protein